MDESVCSRAPRLLAASAAALFLLFTNAVRGGSYSQDFQSYSDGSTAFSDGSLLLSTSLGASALVAGGSYRELQLTAHTTPSVSSAFMLPDLDPGDPVYAFSAKWTAALYGNFPAAADGFSFNFGALTNLNLLTGTIESGYNTGLCFSVQTYASGSPGFYLRVNGTNIASLPYNPTTQWGVLMATRHFFEVDWHHAQGMSVRLNGQAIFSNVPTPGFTPQAGHRFVWAARCGALAQQVRLDNIVVRSGGLLKSVSATSPFHVDANSSVQNPAANAFDNTNSTAWKTFSATGHVGATVGSAVVAYALTSASTGASTEDPQSWRFESSTNSGANWSALSSAQGYFLNRTETRCWSLSNAAPSGAVRLNVITNNGATNIALAELRLYRFEPAPAPYVATNLSYATPLVTVFSTTLGATISSDFGYRLVLDWGTNASYGNQVTFPLDNSGLAQSVSYQIPATSPARPIHYRFTYQYESAPGTSDIVGPNSVVQPAGAAPMLRASYPSFNLEPLPAGWTNVQTNSFFMVADSVAFLDALDRGKMDLLTTGAGVSGPEGSPVIEPILLYNSNPYFADPPFQYGVRAVPGGGSRGARWSGFGAILSFDNRNLPGCAIAGECYYSLWALTGGSSFGLTFFLPVRAPNGTVQIFESIGSSTDTPEFVNGQGLFNPIVFKQLTNGFRLNDIISGPSRAAVADFDQDGFDDVIVLTLTGGLGVGPNYFSSYTPRTFMLRNVANTGLTTQRYGFSITPRVFVSVPTSLPVPRPFSIAEGHLFHCTTATGDVNHDGYPDLFLALRESDGVYRARVFLNQNGRDFVPGPTLIPPGSTRYDRFGADVGANGSEVVTPSSALADFNADGHLDVLIAGWGDFTAPRTAIYYGDGTGQFTDSNIPLPQRAYASVAVGDFFNHGRTDIILSGRMPSNAPPDATARPLLLRNEGGSFTVMDWNLLPSRSLTGRSVAVGDINNDGKLDLATGDQSSLFPLSGLGNFGGYPLVLYTNTLDVPSNQPPAPPVGLASIVSTGAVTLLWTNATDDITPASLLTYNLRVGTTPGGTERVSPLANVTNGWRKVVADGNRGHNFTATLPLAPGTYYWSVQAVDGAFAGGAWAPEQSFTIVNPGRPSLAISATTSNAVKVSWPFWATNWTLQSAATVSTNSWADATNLVPFLRLGGFEVTDPTNGPTEFYRLRSLSP